MGAWSTALFGGDIACDVRDNYLAYLRSGMSNRKATKQILDDYTDELSDAQDGPVVWFALASTQWKYGRLEPRVKATALRLIKKGGDLDAWDPADQKKRRKVLEKVREQLESHPPSEKKIRIQKPATPLKKIERYWQAGQVVAFRRDSGRFVLLLTEGAVDNEHVGEIPYFVLLKWEGAKVPAGDRIQKIKPTNFVVGVWPNRKGQEIPWERIQRLDVVRASTGQVQVERDEVFAEEGFDECSWAELDGALDDEL